MITKEQIKIEVNHIFESGANEARFCEIIERIADQLQADVQQGAELIVRWMKAWQAEKDDNAALTAENAQLRAALQNLIDEQNGPPLEKRRAQWEEAMNEAKAILSK